jgi:hypothetical protein
MEPSNSFFSSPHFLNCFSSDESFVDAFNAFLTEQAGHHAGRVPSLPDLHSYEWALYQLRTNPARDDHGSTSETPLDHARPLILAPHVLLRQFSYPITEIVDYIDYFTASSWYRLAPLYAAAGQTMPSLVIPHAALSEPLLVLLTLRGAEHRILKIKRSQYDALAACDGTRTYDQVLENVEQSERPRVAAWLNHCRQNRMLEYFEP